MRHRRTAWDIAREWADREGEPSDLAAECAIGLAPEELRAAAVAFLTEEITQMRRQAARVAERGMSRLSRFEAIFAVEATRNKAAFAQMDASLERVVVLQGEVDDGQIELEAAVGEVAAIKAAWPEEWQRGQSQYAYWFREQLKIDETLTARVDTETWTATVGHRRPDEIEARRCRTRSSLDYSAADEVRRRDERERAGLLRTATWQEDLERITDLRNRVPFEVTTALLRTKFSTGGRMVTWGDATVADHWTRLEEQTVHAAGTMEDGQRHLEAAEFLQKNHLPCLGALELEAVAA